MINTNVKDIIVKRSKFLKKNVKYFTNFNLLFFLISLNYPDFINLYCLTTCWSFSILTTFHYAYFLDNEAYKKLAKKNEFTMITFHIGNIILHVLPCSYIIMYPPINVTIYHSLIALLIKLLWCYIVTNRTWDLGSVYINFQKENIIKLYSMSCITCISVSYFF